MKVTGNLILTKGSEIEFLMLEKKKNKILFLNDEIGRLYFNLKNKNIEYNNGNRVESLISEEELEKHIHMLHNDIISYKNELLNLVKNLFNNISLDDNISNEQIDIVNKSIIELLDIKIVSSINNQNIINNNIQHELEEIEESISSIENNIIDKISKKCHTYDSLEHMSEHIVNHNLGKKYVFVQVINKDTDEVIIPKKIKFLDENNLVINFSKPYDCVVLVKM